MAGDTVARSVNKFIYIRVGRQIRWIYPPLNKPKTLWLICSDNYDKIELNEKTIFNSNINHRWTLWLYREKRDG
jgi:hypothetical protein